MIITSFFTDINGDPISGLTPLINIYDYDTNNQIVIWDTMLESIGSTDGWYEYDFSSVDDTKLYGVVVDGGVSLGVLRYQHEIITPTDPKTPVVKFN